MAGRAGGLMLALLAAMVMAASVCPAVAADSDQPVAGPGQKFVRLGSGATTPIEDVEGAFQRVLLEPPSDEGMAVQQTWEMDFDLGLKLAALPKAERWATIRRNLGLQPDARILWSEVADAVFDVLAQIPPAKRNRPGPLIFQVSFNGTGDAATANVELTFDGKIAQTLNESIVTAVTGIEGFVTTEPEGGSLADIKVLLYDAGDKLIDTRAPDNTGYFCFTPVEANADFGSDYYLEVQWQGQPLLDLTGMQVTSDAGETLDITKRYVSVVRGARTRCDLRIPNPEEFQTLGSRGGPALGPLGVDFEQVLGLIQGFRTEIPGLEPVLERLPSNPGLHIGMVSVGGGGVETFYGMRYPLKPPVRDCGREAVAPLESKVRLESWWSEDTPDRRYLRIVLLGQVPTQALDLSARPFRQTPWALSLGVVPALDPTLYSVGVSYELNPSLEMVAGVGFQEDEDKSFLLGFTLDMDQILDRVLGRGPATQAAE